FIRYAARVAIENQPVDEWKELVMEETDPVAKMQGTLALARMGDPSSKDNLANGLLSIDAHALSESQQLDLIRTYGLVFSRMGAPANLTSKIKAQLPDYPTSLPALDRELCDLFAYLQEPSLVATTMDLMEQTEATIEADLNTKEVLARSEQYGPTIEAMHENRPLEQGMAYAMSLSRVKTGWTPELRKRYFQWFYRSLTKSGGESYKGFLERVKSTALSQVPDQERSALAELSGEVLLGNAALVSNTGPQPKGPGRNWEVGEANEVLRDGLQHRTYVKGEQMYNALMCGNCHTMQGKGGTIGPDLSQTGTRFSTWDMLRAIQTPSETISDQYGATLFTLNDGRTINGRVIDEQDGVLHINMNPYAPSEFEAVPEEDIREQVPSPVSLMPAGLINRLNEEELLDLMAYLKAGGNPDDEVFQ
ncbi:MAG: hypothetical protein ACR2MT_15505, partial [Aurantibacter sp.]